MVTKKSVEKKSSKEWQELNPEILVYDPDGWDRKNFDSSWNELITFSEYQRRLMHSTVLIIPKNETT